MDIPIAKDWTNFAIPTSTDAPYFCGGTILDVLQHVLCADVEIYPNERVDRGCSVAWPAQALLDKNDNPSLPNPFMSERANLTNKRRLIKTRRGYLGMTSMYTEPGDFVCILFGGTVPFVLRGGPDSWEFIGDCYVHGFMDGEAFEDSDVEIKRFKLV
jgi:hypothetical protein